MIEAPAHSPPLLPRAALEQPALAQAVDEAEANCVRAATRH